MTARFSTIVRQLTASSVRLESLMLAVLAMVLLVNAILLVTGDAALPQFVTVRSGGFSFPALGDSGQPLRNLLWSTALLIVGVLALARLWKPVAMPSPNTQFQPRTACDVTIIVAALVFFGGMYLAYPPQISQTNFRIIWVDWAGADSKIRYFGQIARDFFYGYPHLLQAISALTAFLCMQGIARRTGMSAMTATGFALAAYVSSIFLQFSGVGEDWLIVTAASLAVLWAYASRRRGWLVVVLAMLGGLRLPTALLLLIAIGLTEGLRGAAIVIRNGRRHMPLIAKSYGWGCVSAAAIFAAAYLGYLHFAAYGDDFGSDAYKELTQMQIDGFLLTRFSGAYLSHALWCLPPLVIACCIAAVLSAKKIASSHAGRIALISALAMGGNVLLYEVSVEHQFYYNYRYLAMAYPLGLPVVMYFLARARLGMVYAVIATFSLMFSSIGNVWQAFGSTPSERQRLEHELYSCRHELSPWLEGRTLYVKHKTKALANAITYIEGAGAEDGAIATIREVGRKSSFGEDAAVLLKGPVDAGWVGVAGMEEAAECRDWKVYISR